MKAKDIGFLRCLRILLKLKDTIIWGIEKKCEWFGFMRASDESTLILILVAFQNQIIPKGMGVESVETAT